MRTLTLIDGPQTLSELAPLRDLDDAWRASSAGERLLLVRTRGIALREKIQASGRVTCVRTFDLMTFPYPTRYAFAGAASSRLPYVFMTNRMQVVQYETAAGERRTLLFNPTDIVRSAETPYFVELRRTIGKRLGDSLASWVLARKKKAHEHLATIGVKPEDVDFIAFDHMHTQDVRGLLGGEGAPQAVYPRAKLLVSKAELDIFRAIHPLQRYWYVKDGVRGVPAERIVALDGDTLLGRGVALVRTPGHTVGNWSLVLNTASGIWAVSENGVACDSYSPQASRISGIARFARRNELEVILNHNSVEGRNEQYTSMVLEKTLVDRCADADWVQHFSSSELTSVPLAPGLGPTYRHGAIASGEPRT
jgi:hypothetical protein